MKKLKTHKMAERKRNDLSKELEFMNGLLEKLDIKDSGIVCNYSLE